MALSEESTRAKTYAYSPILEYLNEIIKTGNQINYIKKNNFGFSISSESAHRVY